MQNSWKRDAHFVQGRGRLGTTIVNGLENLGIPIVEELEKADVLWFCVPEKVLESEVEKLISRVGPGVKVVHTSGLLASEVVRLRPDMRVASLHPAYSFSRALPDMPKNILWSFEGDGEVRDLLFSLVRAWNGKWVEIQAEAKIPYHITCVLMGNLVDVPVGAAEEICRQFGFPFSEIAVSLLLPHMEGYKRGQILEKTTGPAARGDFETVEKEREWLRQNFPELEEVYKVLSGLVQKKSV